MLIRLDQRCDIPVGVRGPEFNPSLVPSETLEDGASAVWCEVPVSVRWLDELSLNPSESLTAQWA